MAGVLDGKVVVLTGSSRGLGLASARACATAGARVVLSARSAAAVAEAVAQLRSAGAQATGIACDVADEAQVDALAQHAISTFGRFDVWVNNAGYAAPYGPTVHVPPADFVRTVETNILGAYHGSRTAMRYFLARGSGKLINILGRGDTGGAVPMQNAYASSKSWLRTFTLTLAREHGVSGVGVYAFNPGMMSTEFLTRVEAVAGYEERLNVMPTIIRMWSNPPAVPAQRLVWLASAATDGKTGLEIHQLGRGHMLAGALGEGLRRLFGRRPPAADFRVISVAADSDGPDARKP